MARDPWFRLYAGRDWTVCDGWTLQLMLLPARSLTDEGDEVLMGLGFAVRLFLPRTARIERGHFSLLDLRIRFHARCDAGEIATRRARLHGSLA